MNIGPGSRARGLAAVYVAAERPFGFTVDALLDEIRTAAGMAPSIQSTPAPAAALAPAPLFAVPPKVPPATPLNTASPLAKPMPAIHPTPAKIAPTVLTPADQRELWGYQWDKTPALQAEFRDRASFVVRKSAEQRGRAKQYGTGAAQNIEIGADAPPPASMGAVFAANAAGDTAFLVEAKRLGLTGPLFKDRCVQRWLASPLLQSEFRDCNLYASYMQGKFNGRIR